MFVVANTVISNNNNLCNFLDLNKFKGHIEKLLTADI